MVLILVLVSGVVLAVMLERQSMQSLTIQRELDSYQFHHISRGMQEAIEAWIRSNGNSDIAQALDNDGKAFDLEVEGGAVVHIFFYEGQGTVLADFAGLSGDVLDTAREVLMHLRENVGNAKAMDLVRRDGPVSVSVNTATDEVLRAVIGTVLDRVGTDTLIQAIKKARVDQLIDAQGLNNLYDIADVAADVRPRVSGLLTAQPVVWQVVAEAPAPVGSKSGPIRYGGLALIAGANVTRDKSGSLQRNSSIVSWENLGDR
jgi:hypothetical protein